MNKKEKLGPYLTGGAAVGGTIGATAGLRKLIDTWKTDVPFGKHFSNSSKLLPLYAIVGALAGANAGAGIKYLRKEAEKKNDGLSNTAIGTAATVAGIGAGLLFRKGFRKTPAQIASKGKLNWGLIPDEAATRRLINPKTVGDKLTKEIQYGDVNFINVEKKAKPPAHVEGAFYLDIERTPAIKVPKSDIAYNTNAKLDSTLQDKLQYGKMRGKFIPKSKSLTDVIKGKQIASPDELLNTLASHKTKLYYKPREGEASGGKGHFSHDALIRMTKDPVYKQSRSRELNDMFADKENYIAQKQLDVKKVNIGPNKDMPTTERRVHFAVHDNKVKVLSPKIPRWFDIATVKAKPHVARVAGGSALVGASAATVDEDKRSLKRTVVGGAIGATLGVGGAKLLENGVALPKYYVRKDKKQLQRGLQEIWDKNPQIKTKSHSIIGADIVTDKKNKLWAIELNEQSGLLHPDMTPHRIMATHNLYKHITGRDTRLMSAAKGALVGGATAAGLKIVNKKGRD